MNTDNMIFVFGSNLAGIHGAGAARFAVKHKGAIMGKAIGRQGQSYAIPTKDAEIKRTLDVKNIKICVNAFIMYSRFYSELDFQITCIGCGLAGLRHKDVAPLFEATGKNCYFDELWRPYLGDEKQYWGTV